MILYFLVIVVATAVLLSRRGNNFLLIHLKIDKNRFRLLLLKGAHFLNPLDTHTHNKIVFGCSLCIAVVSLDSGCLSLPKSLNGIDCVTFRYYYNTGAPPCEEEDDDDVVLLPGRAQGVLQKPSGYRRLPLPSSPVFSFLIRRRSISRS